MNLLCINTHNFIYDIKYPVLISLYDENSLDGFTFQFATQAILDNNQPRENRLGTEDIAATNKRVCESADMPMRIYAIDEETGASLNHASIGFSCAGTFCDLGETDVVSVDDYALDVKMPQCLNGIININREGYGQSNLIIDTLSKRTSKKELLREILKKTDYKSIRKLALRIKKNKKIKKQRGCLGFKIGDAYVQLID